MNLDFLWKVGWLVGWAPPGLLNATGCATTTTTAADSCKKNSCNMMIISSLEISLLLQNLDLSAAPICVVVDYSETC